MARKDVEEYVLKLMLSLTTTKTNSGIYKKRFAEMNDAQFKKWVEAVIAKKSKLVVWLPQDGTSANLENCVKFAKSKDYDFFQRLVINETATVPKHLTSVPHLVALVPMRRQTQTFSKKVSTAKDDKLVDALTGQATGRQSSPTSISAPENRILAGIGLKFTAREFNKIRGGDTGAYKAYRHMLETGGSASQQSIEQFATGAGSLANLRCWMAGKHIGTNI